MQLVNFFCVARHVYITENLSFVYGTLSLSNDDIYHEKVYYVFSDGRQLGIELGPFPMADGRIEFIGGNQILAGLAQAHFVEDSSEDKRNNFLAAFASVIKPFSDVFDNLKSIYGVKYGLGISFLDSVELFRVEGRTLEDAGKLSLSYDYAHQIDPDFLPEHLLERAEKIQATNESQAWKQNAWEKHAAARRLVSCSDAERRQMLAEDWNKHPATLSPDQELPSPPTV